VATAHPLAQIRELGMGYAICYFADAAYDRSSIDLFADKVIPETRALI
jgi:hypothetical protein